MSFPIYSHSPKAADRHTKSPSSGWKILCFIANRIVQIWSPARLGPTLFSIAELLFLPPTSCPSLSLSRSPEPPPRQPLVRPVPPLTRAPPCYLRYVARFPPSLHGTTQLPTKAQADGRGLGPTQPPGSPNPTPALEGRGQELLQCSHGNRGHF